MKKYLSLVLSASLTLSALAPAAVIAEGSENTAPTLENMVVLGDSIARGYGLDETEHSYAEICADYFGANLDNFSEDGLDTAELLAMLQNPTDEQKESIAKSEVIVVSIGGNDILHYGIKTALEFAAPRGLLKEGYTAEDIPEIPATRSINMLDMDAFKDYANGGLDNQLALDTALTTFTNNLTKSGGFNPYGGEYQGIIQNEIMVNIDNIVKTIKEINPDTQIVMQTVYQPFQLSPDYIEKNHGEGYAMMLRQLRTKLNSVMDNFKEELVQIDDIEIIDVYDTFTALENGSADSKDATPGYAYYFTDMQQPYSEDHEDGTMDFHPNQKGHLAIASLLLDAIKVKDSETGEMVKPAPAERPIDEETGEAVPTLFDITYDSIEDIADYPPLAMEQIVEALPDRVVPGDVNGDGLVNAVDASLISMEYASLSLINPVSTFTEEQTKLGDLNYDGKVDARDASYVAMYYAYLSTIPQDENGEPLEEEMNIFSFMNNEQMKAAQK